MSRVPGALGGVCVMLGSLGLLSCATPDGRSCAAAPASVLAKAPSPSAAIVDEAPPTRDWPAEEFEKEPDATWPELGPKPPWQISRAPKACRVATPSQACAEPHPTTALLGALSESSDPPRRDAALAALTPCFAEGFIAAVRAHAWVECGEQIAIDAGPRVGPIRAELVASAFAARQRGFVAGLGKAPRISAAMVAHYQSKHLESWLRPRLDWLREQERLVDGFAPGSAPRALALWALSESWVDLLRAPMARPLDVDAQIKSNYELRKRFYEALDHALAEARASARAVFLRAFDAIGKQGEMRPYRFDAWGEPAMRAVLELPRSSSWRPALAWVVPPVPHIEAKAAPGEQLLRRLPVHLGALLLKEPALSARDGAVSESLLVRGLAPAVRRTLAQRIKAADARGADTELSRLLWLRARHYLRAGLLSFDRRQFQWAHADLERLSEGLSSRVFPKRTTDEVRWAHALAEVLRRGPASAAAWATRPALDTAPLERVAASVSLDAGARGAARAAAAQLRSGSATEVLQMKAIVRMLRQAQEEVDDPVVWACVREQDRAYTAHPWWGGPEAECEAYRLEMSKLSQSEKALRVNYGYCPWWPWFEPVRPPHEGPCADPGKAR